MMHILYSFMLITASLQSGWAFFSEGHLLALPIVVLMLYIGWKNLVGGISETCLRE